jgi:TetR/AcrR family transcriptional repressor of nem operon
MMIIIIESIGSSRGKPMKISKAQAGENREKIVGAAASLFRERGFDGVSVGDLTRAAGFSHGGFYNHFQSKDALASEALDSAFKTMAGHRERARDLPEMLTHYLSQAARRAPGKSCPAAALGGDVGRQPDDLKAVFAAGVEQMIVSVEARLPDTPDRRQRALGVVTRMAGALMLARAVPDGALADELLETNLKLAIAEAS